MESEFSYSQAQPYNIRYSIIIDTESVQRGGESRKFCNICRGHIQTVQRKWETGNIINTGIINDESVKKGR